MADYHTIRIFPWLGFFMFSVVAGSASSITEGIYTTRLNNTDIVIVECTIDSSKESLKGVKLVDESNNVILVSVSLRSRRCTTHKTLASCLVNEIGSYVTLSAAIADIKEGETRKYKCEADYFDSHQRTGFHPITVKGETAPSAAPAPCTTCPPCSVSDSTTQTTRSQFSKPPTPSITEQRTEAGTSPASMSDSQTDTDEPGKYPIDILSAVIGSCVTLVVTILVVMVICLWRRQRWDLNAGHACAHQDFPTRAPAEAIPLHQFPAGRNISDEGDSMYLHPSPGPRRHSDQKNVRAARRRPAPALPPRGILHSSLYLTPTRDDQCRQHAQRPLPRPQNGPSRSCTMNQMASHSRAESQESTQVKTLALPSPPSCGRTEPVHVSSPYDEVSVSS